MVSQAQDTFNKAINFVKEQVDKLLDMIMNFSDEMCRSTCTNFFNLPCFLIFRCTAKIKRFFFLLVLPILIIVVIFGGLFSGVFSLGCLLRVIGCITGIYLVVCIVKCVMRKFDKDNVKEKAMEKARAEYEAKEAVAKEKEIKRDQFMYENPENPYDCVRIEEHEPVTEKRMVVQEM